MFFERAVSKATGQNNMNYYEDLLAYNQKAEVPDLPYSNVYAIKGVVESIPQIQYYI